MVEHVALIRIVTQDSYAPVINKEIQVVVNLKKKMLSYLMHHVILTMIVALNYVLMMEVLKMLTLKLFAVVPLQKLYLVTIVKAQHIVQMKGDVKQDLHVQMVLVNLFMNILKLSIILATQTAIVPVNSV